jgi:RNA polymerase sigma factor (sigma-70 family)
VVAEQNAPRAVVYVVDDDDDLRQSLCWLLEGVGISPLGCADAQSFVDAYDVRAPAVVIVDVRMPGESGFAVQQRLNDMNSPAQVIFCSAHGDIAMAVRSMQGGAVTFLEKPYEPQQLIDVVQRCLLSASQSFFHAEAQRSMASRLERLTDRERDVLSLVVQGLSSQHIARQLGTSVKTVDVHRSRIKSKTASESLSVLVHEVLQAGVQVDYHGQ